ncbi:hypothetical protein LEA_15053, partial [human gut metagenome]
KIMLQFITTHTDRYDEIAGTRAVLEGGLPLGAAPHERHSGGRGAAHRT